GGGGGRDGNHNSSSCSFSSSSTLVDHKKTKVAFPLLSNFPYEFDPHHLLHNKVSDHHHQKQYHPPLPLSSTNYSSSCNPVSKVLLEQKNK
ncbi:hypothetical protein LINPERPRIM_LOCUS6958, partial [Linum perenne]